MKRTAFSRTPFVPRPARQWEGDAIPSQKPKVELRIADGKARAVVSLPKKPPFRSETYRCR